MEDLSCAIHDGRRSLFSYSLLHMCHFDHVGSRFDDFLAMKKKHVWLLSSCISDVLKHISNDHKHHMHILVRAVRSDLSDSTVSVMGDSVPVISKGVYLVACGCCFMMALITALCILFVYLT